ncbi:MAG: ribosomal RNA small subunit methyltransferase A [bacterium]|nr:ribosomal RNA small subunit methyltransferase A [bacterium]
MNKTEVIALTNQYGLSPNKRLGQNFLISEAMTQKILKAVSAVKTDVILEIGPGLGALTEPLLEQAGAVTAVEIDSGMAASLENRYGERENFSLYHKDFLKLDLDPEFTKIVSNLPYYCASEILFRIAHQYRADELYIMIQKEMAERIISPPGHKNYGALSVTLGFYFEAKILFTVERNSFFPRPDVSSSFMRLTRKKDLPLDEKGKELFHLVVKSAFWGRRKTLVKALTDSPHLELSRQEVTGILEKAEVEQTLRGESLGINEYVRIASAALGGG